MVAAVPEDRRDMLGSDQKALDDRVALACGDDRGGKGHAEADSLAGVRVADCDRDRGYAPVGFVIRLRKSLPANLR
jgi:hypothetical protein